MKSLFEVLFKIVEILVFFVKYIFLLSSELFCLVLFLIFLYFLIVLLMIFFDLIVLFSLFILLFIY